MDLSKLKQWDWIAQDTQRMEVPGGWLYRVGNPNASIAMVFVPFTADDWEKFRMEKVSE